jgi:peptidoglycan hydrolase-like protein with peptidoglycan-binding domain
MTTNHRASAEQHTHAQRTQRDSSRPYTPLQLSRRIIAAAVAAVLLSPADARPRRRFRLRRIAAVAVSAAALSTGGAIASGAPADAAPSARAGCTINTNVKLGDSNAHVACLERTLQSLGLQTRRIDGYYGMATRATIVKFQQAHKLHVDGWVGPQTGKALGIWSTSAPAVNTPSSPAPAAGRSTVSVPALGMVRPIVWANTQADVDACRGANIWFGAPNGGRLWLAAHRTSCSTQHFNGIQNLADGSHATVTRADGTIDRYIKTGMAIQYVGSAPNWHGADLVLQTTKSGDAVYTVLFRRH